jgi:hypothetical protein
VTAKTPKKAAAPPIADPVDVVDGIPDRSRNPRLWKYLVLAVLFLAWVAFLVFCLVWGAP